MFVVVVVVVVPFRVDIFYLTWLYFRKLLIFLVIGGGFIERVWSLRTH